MAKAAPAYSHYPDAFEQGTATMTLAEVGGYMRLLNHQWATGSIPGDDVKKIAKILRCTTRVAKGLWIVICVKFLRGEDGVWKNVRLEQERAKQQRRAKALARNGAKGGHAKASSLGQQTASNRLSETCQETHNSDNQLLSLPSPLKDQIVPKEVPPPPISTPSGARSVPLVVGPLKFAKQAENFAWFGSRLRVPHVLHDELRTKLGGLDTDARLRQWYDQVNTEADVGGTPIVDVFVLLRPKFLEWVSDAAADAELEKFRPKEARWTGPPGSGSTSACAPRMAKASTVSNARPTTKA
jgi:uncharacterized protein YdaU (DUF1376 family)